METTSATCFRNLRQTENPFVQRQPNSTSWTTFDRFKVWFETHVDRNKQIVRRKRPQHSNWNDLFANTGGQGVTQSICQFVFKKERVGIRAHTAIRAKCDSLHFTCVRMIWFVGNSTDKAGCGIFPSRKKPANPSLETVTNERAIAAGLLTPQLHDSLSGENSRYYI